MVLAGVVEDGKDNFLAPHLPAVAPQGTHRGVREFFDRTFARHHPLRGSLGARNDEPLVHALLDKPADTRPGIP